MSGRERVNVMLSRARDALIMVGNAQTFLESRKGREVWGPLLDLLKQDGHVYDGLPILCERHPEKIELVRSPEEFDVKSPDGGCTDPW